MLRLLDRTIRTADEHMKWRSMFLSPRSSIKQEVFDLGPATSAKTSYRDEKSNTPWLGNMTIRYITI